MVLLVQLPIASGKATEVGSGELATGVIATAKGMINGAAVDTDGLHLTIVKVGDASQRSRTGHVVQEVIAQVGGGNTDPSSDTDLQTSEEIAAAGHGIPKKLQSAGLAENALGEASEDRVNVDSICLSQGQAFGSNTTQIDGKFIYGGQAHT